jgi:hypothetical protein
MRILCAVAIIGLTVVVALPAAAQNVEIEATRPPAEREAKIVPPPLHYETTRPPDGDVRPNLRGADVEHDPAFIEPLAGSYQTANGSGRYGLSGWTAPNSPVGAQSTNWQEVTGWFALGFSVTWGGPPAAPRPAQRPPR